MVAVSLIWLNWVFSGTVGDASWAHVNPVDRSAIVGGTVTIGALSLLFPAVILLMFRKTE
jgi:hypothetical protein